MACVSILSLPQRPVSGRGPRRGRTRWGLVFAPASPENEAMSSAPQQELNPDFWRRCNSCKKPIGYGADYWVCNVSTCNRKRTGLVFCDVSCWDAHIPMMNHRESWAEE